MPEKEILDKKEIFQNVSDKIENTNMKLSNLADLVSNYAFSIDSKDLMLANGLYAISQAISDRLSEYESILDLM